MFVGEDGGNYIWAIDEGPMTVSRLPVEVKGVTSLGLKVSGLEAGQLIATAGVHFLHEGQKVTLLDGQMLDGEEQP